jgi:hypothetical protein
MRPHEPNDVSDQKSPTRSSYGSLFYFQQEGQRSYLRFTWLGAILVILIIVIPVSALLILFYINSRSAPPQVNTNITTQPTPSFSANTPLIQEAPARAPVKAVKPSAIPPKPTLVMPDDNLNKPSTPKQTPQPLPSESPP